MEFVLTALRRTPVETPGVLEAYVAIDVYSLDNGVTMGKNDVWIAATAQVTGATLLTTDHDFDHLAGIFLTREWIDPQSP
jgi:tRNA(fMet)-specific endonuclease VapC